MCGARCKTPLAPPQEPAVPLEEVLAGLQPACIPHAVAHSLASGAQWPLTFVHAPPLVTAVQFFYAHVGVPPHVTVLVPPPALDLGTYHPGWLLGGVSTLFSGGLVDVSEMVILYDLSWSLF